QSQGRMNYSRRRKRNIWIWVGVTLLSISALFWLIVVATVVAGLQDVGFMILAGLFLSIVPTGVGIYCLWHGKRRYRRRIFY
ncbi:MAG: hypothetical protein JSW15_05170, partial [Deltaproteobacteria bacterium]